MNNIGIRSIYNFEPINTPSTPLYLAQVQADARRSVLADPMTRTREAMVHAAVTRYMIQEGM